MLITFRLQSFESKLEGCWGLPEAQHTCDDARASMRSRRLRKQPLVQVALTKCFFAMPGHVPRPSSYPLLGPKYPLLGTIYPQLRVQGGSWLESGRCENVSGRAHGDQTRKLKLAREQLTVRATTPYMSYKLNS